MINGGPQRPPTSVIPSQKLGNLLGLVDTSDHFERQYFLLFLAAQAFLWINPSCSAGNIPAGLMNVGWAGPSNRCLEVLSRMGSHGVRVARLSEVGSQGSCLPFTFACFLS